jgi:putative ABC transport system permease protein
MPGHYYTTAIRHLKKHFFFTTIAVIGLSLGMVSFIVLMNYARHERSYDSFNKDADHIYRCEAWFKKNGARSDSWASSSFGYAKAAKDAMPEVKDITRVDNYDCERIVRYQNKIFREPRVVFVDSNFFSFFSYPLLKGNIKEVLNQPNTIAISETMAKKYFGDE